MSVAQRAAPAAGGRFPAEAPSGEAGTVPALDRAAALSFLLFVAALPWSIAPISIAAGVCGALTLTLWLRRARLGSFRTPLFFPWLGWLAALAIVTLFALDPAGSAPRIQKGALFALVPLAAYHTRGERARRRMMAVLLVSGAAAALFALGKFIADGAAFPARVKGLTNHPLTYGGQAMFLASVAGAVVLRAPEGRWRLSAAAFLTLLAPALLGSFTRSAWIATAVAFGVLIARVRARWLGAFAALLILGVAALPDGYRERALSTFQPGTSPDDERLYLWDAGVRMFRDHPLTGVGLQDLRDLYRRYRSPRAVQDHGHLHSIPVHVAATMGLVGLAALAWLFVGLYRTAGRKWRVPLPRDGLAGALRLAAVAGLTGFLAAGLFEWNLGDEELIDFLCVLVGAGYAAGQEAAPSDATSRNRASAWRDASSGAS